jgi:hypothetical protein
VRRFGGARNYDPLPTDCVIGVAVTAIVATSSVSATVNVPIACVPSAFNAVNEITLDPAASAVGSTGRISKLVTPSPPLAVEVGATVANAGLADTTVIVPPPAVNAAPVIALPAASNIFNTARNPPATSFIAFMSDLPPVFRAAASGIPGLAIGAKLISIRRTSCRPASNLSIAASRRNIVRCPDNNRSSG